MAIFKVRNVPLSNIINFGSNDPLNLIDITSDSRDNTKSISEFLKSPGSFVYETRFTVNENLAIRQGVIGISFEFFASKPKVGDVPLRENNFVVEIRQPQLGEKEDTKVQKAAIYLGVEELKGIAGSIANLKTVSIEQPAATTPFKQSAKNLELNQRSDPAHILSAGKILSKTPKDVLNFGNQNYLKDQVSQNFAKLGADISETAKSLSGIRSSLKESRNFKNNSLLSDFLNLKTISNPQSLVKNLPSVIAEVISKDTEYTRQLFFEKSTLLGFSKLYVRVGAIVNPGLPVKFQSRTFVIPHQREVDDFFSNPEPPVIVSTESTFGRVSFVLKRTDPTLRRVLVVRITKNPNLVNAIFENVKVIEFGKSDSVIFRDVVDNVAPNTVIYRFIVQNDDGSNGEFTSSVLTSFSKVTSRQSIISATTPISIRAINRRNGIEVVVDTLNDQVQTLRLLRQDMGAIGEFSETVSTVLDLNGQESQIVAGEKKSITFIDTDVVVGRHYRYFAAYRIGSPAEASLCREAVSDEDETIIRYKASNDLPFASDITPAFLTQDESNAITIQFDMNVSQIDEQYNMLIDALQQAGISQQFISDLQNDKQKIKQVAAFLVERVDRVSGRRVSFGIFAPGKFVDSPATRSKLSIQAPLPGRKYEYICKLCIRPSNVFLLQATTGFTATNSSQGDITEVLAAKFQNALIGRGILPSERQLREGVSIRENFYLGLTGLEQSTTINVPVFAPKIENISARERKPYTLISWSTSGDMSNISYFLVYCNYNGTDELIGTVSSVGKNAMYQYKDTRFYDEVGKKSYYVKFVTLDNDVATVSANVEITTSFSVPPTMLKDYVLIPTRNEVKGVAYKFATTFGNVKINTANPASQVSTVTTITTVQPDESIELDDSHLSFFRRGKLKESRKENKNLATQPKLDDKPVYVDTSKESEEMPNFGLDQNSNPDGQQKMMDTFESSQKPPFKK